jgi:hypothetical protein
MLGIEADGVWRQDIDGEVRSEPQHLSVLAFALRKCRDIFIGHVAVTPVLDSSSIAVVRLNQYGPSKSMPAEQTPEDKQAVHART